VRYRTIVADPPWRYGQTRILTTANKPETRPEASAQYATMAPDEIAALPVPEWAEDNAHLYLWTTNPKLWEAPSILEAWGFRYVTLLTWHKLGTFGLGYHFRGDTEHVVFAVRGTLPIAPALRVSNHFAARKTGHSRKPDRFYEMVERVSPGPLVRSWGVKQGDRLRVCANPVLISTKLAVRCVVVTVFGFCPCRARHGVPDLLDLSSAAFLRLGAPLSQGLEKVTVSYNG
jgi:N6-adenosine-specific RNA methylase IME4